MWETWIQSLGWEDVLEKGTATHSIFLGFFGGSAGNESTCNAVLGRSPGEGKGYPLQYSDLENSMDCIVHGVAKSWKQLSHFHFAKPIAVLFFLIKTRQFCIMRGVLLK